MKGKGKKALIMIMLASLIIILMSNNVISAELRSDELFLELKVNDEKTATSIFTADLSLVDKEVINPYSDFKITFNEVCGHVKSYKIMIDSVCEKQIPIYKELQVCHDIIDNKTSSIIQNCYTTKEIIGYETTYYSCKKEATDKDLIKGIKDYEIKAIIEMERCFDGGFGYKIDWIPEISINDYSEDTISQVKWAWWNNTYTSKYFIDCQEVSSGTAIVVNGSGGWIINNSREIIWTNCKNNLSLYFNNASEYAIVENDSVQVPHEVEIGNGTSYNPTAVWDINFKGVFHMNSNQSSTAGNEQGMIGLNVKIVSSEQCIVGSCMNFTQNVTKPYNFNFTDNGFYDGWTQQTTEFWRFGDFIGTNQKVISKGSQGGSFATYLLTYSGTIAINSDTAGENYFAASFNTSRSPTNYIVFDYNSTYMSAYLNATSGGGQADTGVFRDSNLGFMIGGNEYEAAGFQYKGILDEVRISNISRGTKYYTDTYNNLMGTLGYGSLGDLENTTADLTPVFAFLFPPDNNVSLSSYLVADFIVTDDIAVSLSCGLYVNDSLNASNSSTINNTLTSISSSSLEAGTYEWYINCSDGVNTAKSNTSNFIYITCVEDWVATYSVCNSSDQMIKTYVDDESCGTTYFLPGDNGTNVTCNYCSQNITAITSACIGGFQTTTYSDLNFISCCYQTGFLSDCSILYSPYNSSLVENCTANVTGNVCDDNLTNDFICQYDSMPIIKNKINVVCEMPDTNDYCCVVNILQNNTLLATTPEYKDSVDALISWKVGEEESRVCFEPNNKLLNSYYQNKNLRMNTFYTLQVKCVSNNSSIVSEYCVMPIYEKPDEVAGRMVWASQNIVYIVMIIFILFLLALIAGKIRQKVKYG